MPDTNSSVKHTDVDITWIGVLTIVLALGALLVISTQGIMDSNKATSTRAADPNSITKQLLKKVQSTTKKTVAPKKGNEKPSASTESDNYCRLGVGMPSGYNAGSDYCPNGFCSGDFYTQASTGSDKCWQAGNLGCCRSKDNVPYVGDGYCQRQLNDTSAYCVVSGDKNSCSGAKVNRTITCAKSTDNKKVTIGYCCGTYTPPVSPTPNIPSLNSDCSFEHYNCSGTTWSNKNGSESSICVVDKSASIWTAYCAFYPKVSGSCASNKQYAYPYLTTNGSQSSCLHVVSSSGPYTAYTGSTYSTSVQICKVKKVTGTGGAEGCASATP